jgi:hypothetical protein
MLNIRRACKQLIDYDPSLTSLTTCIAADRPTQNYMSVFTKGGLPSPAHHRGIQL